LRGNGIPYRGINVVMLWSAAMDKGYAAPIWLTFKQAQELKANVRKGEKGTLVVYADKIAPLREPKSAEGCHYSLARGIKARRAETRLRLGSRVPGPASPDAP
jgi:antirestriction protein ArdC